MRLLVTFAVEAEFAPWRKLRRFSQIAAEGVPAFSSQVGAAEIVVLLTGVGGRKAWAGATKIIWDRNVDVCISSGLAGALRRAHRPGDVLAARRVHATSWKKVISSDSALLEMASASGAKIVDAFYTVDRVLVRAEEKLEISAKADAVEMESGDILLEAVAFGAKVIAVRGISDAAEQDLPLDFNRVMTETGNVSIPRILVQAATHPGSLPALIRFARQSHRGAKNLANVLERYVQKLANIPMSRGSKQVPVT
jgi:adenosylhomocysteine nucleosidase